MPGPRSGTEYLGMECNVCGKWLVGGKPKDGFEIQRALAVSEALLVIHYRNEHPDSEPATVDRLSGRVERARTLLAAEFPEIAARGGL